MTVKERLWELGLFNTHELLKRFADPGRDVACLYYPSQTRGSCAKTQVYSPSHDTDPSAAWYDYRKKTFVGLRTDSMPLAEVWASAVYRVEHWVPCPTDPSARVPLAVRTRALKFIKEND